MVIEKSVDIHASRERVWDTFSHLACWGEWCSAVSGVSCPVPRVEPGVEFSFCIRPFSIPLTVRPRVEDVVPMRRVVWRGRKWGIKARHEFLFEEHGGGVRLLSTERFTGIIFWLFRLFFPRREMERLSGALLRDLKRAAEGGSLTI